MILNFWMFWWKICPDFKIMYFFTAWYLVGFFFVYTSSTWLQLKRNWNGFSKFHHRIIDEIKTRSRSKHKKIHFQKRNVLKIIGHFINCIDICIYFTKSTTIKNVKSLNIFNRNKTKSNNETRLNCISK